MEGGRLHVCHVMLWRFLVHPSEKAFGFRFGHRCKGRGSCSSFGLVALRLQLQRLWRNFVKQAGISLREPLGIVCWPWNGLLPLPKQQ